MKKVLLLGAGLVAKPLVRYLLDLPDFHVKVASRTVSKAEELLQGHPQGEAAAFDITASAPEELDALVSQADVAVSLLPYIHHVKVAEACLRHRKHLVTTSYVSPAMRALGAKAKDAGVLFLNEIGLDPGIDHMSAMAIIHRVQNQGGQIVSFRSYCGGLPAPEANTNPLGYKFSWSPLGVVLAGRNAARYLEDGKIVEIVSGTLFDNYHMLPVEGLGEFEAYPNRDSLGYLETYGITGAQTMYRGTLRNPDWCRTWQAITKLGLLQDSEIEAPANLTLKTLLARLIGADAGEELRPALAAYLDIKPDDAILDRLAWLGFLSDEPLPPGPAVPLQILAAKLNAKMQYQPGERDMIVLLHQFIAAYPGRPQREFLTSTLIDFGIPHGDSSMARTVSLPAAIGVKLILEGALTLTGVHVPVLPEIYEPVLKELAKLGIVCKETSKVLA